MHPELISFLCHLADRRSPRTTKNYGAVLSTFTAFCDEAGASWPPPRTTVEAFLVRPTRAGKRRAAATRNQELAALRAFFGWAERERGWSENPTEGIPFEREAPRDPPVLTADELRRLFRVAAEVSGPAERARNLALLAVGSQAGLRVHELVGLDVDQVDLLSATLVGVHGKGGTVHDMPLNAPTTALLTAWLADRTQMAREDEPALFVSSRGTRLSIRATQKLVQRLRQEMGTAKKVTPHTLRHTAATLALTMGADLSTVADILRHSDLNTTRRYLHLVDARKREAIGRLGTLIPADIVPGGAHSTGAVPNEANAAVVVPISAARGGASAAMATARPAVTSPAAATSSMPTSSTSGAPAPSSPAAPAGKVVRFPTRPDAASEQKGLDAQHGLDEPAWLERRAPNTPPTPIKGRSEMQTNDKKRADIGALWVLGGDDKAQPASSTITVSIGSGKSTTARLFKLVPILLALMVLVGCGQTVKFNVLRAPSVNVVKLAGGKTPTVSVGDWTSSNPSDRQAAQEIAQYLREAITNAPGGLVRFAQSGGVVTLHGNLLEHSHSDEISESLHKCYRTEGKQQIAYKCTQYTRNGRARLRVSMNVIDAQGRTVAAETVPVEAVSQTSATDEQPPAIDWRSTMLDMRKEAAKKLAKNVVPYRVTVSKPWFSCGTADKLCDAGLADLRQGLFDAARTSFNQALDQLQAAAERDKDAMAAAFWALALTAEFDGDFDKAEELVAKAIELDPDEDAYRLERSSISTEKAHAAQLADHGLGD